MLLFFRNGFLLSWEKPVPHIYYKGISPDIQVIFQKVFPNGGFSAVRPVRQAAEPPEVKEEPNMKKSDRCFRYRRWLAVAVLFLSMTLRLLPYRIAGADEPAPVTPALYVLARDLHFYKSGLRGTAIGFTPYDFEMALGTEKLDSVTIRELPSATAGKLMLGGLEIMKDQTVSRANIRALRFVPNDSKVTRTSFVFEAGGEHRYEAVCTLHLLDRENAAPTAAGIDPSQFVVSTYKNIAVYGVLPAEDREDDALCYEIVTAPRQGLLWLIDRVSGRFVYTPTKNFTGRDSFTYAVTDEYGNRSETITMTVRVDRSENGTVFEDMIDRPAHNDAIRLSDRGIMTGSKVGQKYRFEPEGTVSRADFLMMAMKATGNDVTETESVRTVFCDDEEIPDSARLYVAEAWDKGYIEGTEKDGLPYFDPAGSLTVAEACVMIGNMLEAIPAATRSAAEPPDAEKEALTVLDELGLRSQPETAVSLSVQLTREKAAELLCAVLLYR